ncbi:MarR family winged helix-turn-helix transcriptional regulator [Actinoplanes sp. M2I2]|uniref:MarR family winged helix-turn-helix transcriptional regulator n=1 Tax=Actinoplanes sp. M2I2 TaxID=1734444 RepID=UPI0020206E30|nr:MarR family transcriptional regulator [Actinoplanes sp. M2I2]
MKTFLNAAITVQRNINADLSEHHGNLIEYTTLRQLAGAPVRRMRISELAAATHLSVSWTSRVVERLAKRGLVRRELVIDDRRGWNVIATDTGIDWLTSGKQSYASSVRRHTTSLLDPDTVRTVTAAARVLAGLGDPARALSRPS